MRKGYNYYRFIFLIIIIFISQIVDTQEDQAQLTMEGYYNLSL